jgi:hypothetical protein
MVSDWLQRFWAGMVFEDKSTVYPIPCPGSMVMDLYKAGSQPGSASAKIRGHSILACEEHALEQLYSSH